MIREIICYKCKCAKCAHDWATKSHDLPQVCPKCKTYKWNIDYVEREAAGVAPAQTASVSPSPELPERFATASVNPAMEKFLAVMEAKKKPLEQPKATKADEPNYVPIDFIA